MILARFLSLSILVVIANLPPLAYADVTVSLSYPPHKETRQSWQLNQEVRLSQIIDLAALPHDKVYWPSARLTSNIKQQEVEQERTRLVNLINEYAFYIEQRSNDDYARQVRQFAHSLKSIELLPTYLWGIDYGQLKVRVDENPVLKHGEKEVARQFVISFHNQPEVQCIIGVGVPWQCVSVSEDESLRFLLKQKNVLSLVKNGTVWLAQYNGETIEVPVDYYNAVEVPQRVGNIVLVGLVTKNVPEKYEAINRKLAELLAHACIDDCEKVIP